MAVPNSTITLSCGGVNITVERQVVEHSMLIQRMLEDLDDFGKPIEIKVSASVMEKVLEWCTHHRNEPREATKISEWDENFMQVDLAEAFYIILAAQDLEIQGLLDFACKTVGKSAEEVICCVATCSSCYYDPEQNWNF